MTSKPTYEPDLRSGPGHGGGLEQAFHADKLVVEREKHFTLVGFAETRHGATIHGLLITLASKPSGLPSADFCVEFNDQGNSCGGDETATLQLAPGRLIVDFADKAHVVAGRVSYADEADVLAGPSCYPDKRIHRLVVEFEATPNQLLALRQELSRAEAFGCRFEYLEG